MGHLSSLCPPASEQGGPPWIFLFPWTIWASCSVPQDAPSRQPSHVPLRSWEMDYFTQAFANDGSNLNLQVGVDGRNSQASVSISLPPPTPAAPQHLLHTFAACGTCLVSFEFLSSLTYGRSYDTWSPEQGRLGASGRCGFVCSRQRFKAQG